MTNPELSPSPSHQITRGVSFYSYQEEYFTRAMTLVDCVEEVRSMGATGVQLISEQMIPAYPSPPSAWIDAWFVLLERTGTKPTSLDVYWDFNVGGHRDILLDEAFEVVSGQIRLASELGFGVLRPTEGKPNRFSAIELMTRLLPVAERHGIVIAPEIHSPELLTGAKTQRYLDLIHETQTQAFGLTLDMSLFQTRYPRIARDRKIRDGQISEQIGHFITTAHEQGEKAEAVQARLSALEATAAEERFFEDVYRDYSINAETLTSILPHVANIHAKIFEMTDEITEYSIPYEEIVPLIVAGGYHGSIDTEYEGQRYTQDLLQTDSCEQVRRNQLLLRRLLGEC